MAEFSSTDLGPLQAAPPLIPPSLCLEVSPSSLCSTLAQPLHCSAGYSLLLAAKDLDILLAYVQGKNSGGAA